MQDFPSARQDGGKLAYRVRGAAPGLRPRGRGRPLVAAPSGFCPPLDSTLSIEQLKPPLDQGFPNFPGWNGLPA